jgi:hypothetical protein
MPKTHLNRLKLEKIIEMSTMDRHILIASGTAMKASIVDLRYKTKDILKALERNESVTVLYHGKVRGVIKPAKQVTMINVRDHEFFGMNKSLDKNVLEELESLRKSRHDI